MKTLLATLLLTTLPINNAVPDTADDHNTFQLVNEENIQVVVNPEVAYQGQYYEYYYKQTFNMQNDAQEINAISYSYMYGEPYTLSTPNTKYVHLSKSSHYDFAENNHIELTPRQIIYLDINNFYKLDTFELTLNFVQTLFGSSTEQHQKIYYSSITQDWLWNNAGWQNLRFFENSYIRLAYELYSNNLYDFNEQIYGTLDFTFEEDDLECRKSHYSLIIFNYYTTDNNQSINATNTAGNNTKAQPHLDTNSNVSTYWTTKPTGITQEVIDIPDLMFTILTMPFSFISQAFNLTLFSGTKYQINISQLFLAIIGVMIFIMLLKIIISATANKG